MRLFIDIYILYFRVKVSVESQNDYSRLQSNTGRGSRNDRSLLLCLCLYNIFNSSAHILKDITSFQEKDIN